MPTMISQQAFVTAFYTTNLFKLERLILRWLVARPSSDAQAARLASGQIENFAAWVVEARSDNQLLLSDYQHRTRSWLMAEPSQAGEGAGTLLYFGSAVMPVIDPANGKRSLGPVFRALLGFHKLYSVALLRAGVARLKREAVELSG